MRVHASCVASCGRHRHRVEVVVDPDRLPGTGLGQPGQPSMVGHCSAGSMPARSSRQPCGTKMPKRMVWTLCRGSAGVPRGEVASPGLSRGRPAHCIPSIPSRHAHLGHRLRLPGRGARRRAWPTSGHDVVGVDVDEEKVDGAVRRTRAVLRARPGGAAAPGAGHRAAALQLGRGGRRAPAGRGRPTVHFICVGTPQRRGRVRRRTCLRRGRRRGLLPAPAPGRPRRRQVHRPGRHGGPRSPRRLARRRRRAASCWPGTRSSCARATRSRTPSTPTGWSTALPPDPDAARAARALLDAGVRRGRSRRAAPSSSPTWRRRSWSRAPRTRSWRPRSRSSTRWPRCARRPAPTSWRWPTRSATTTGSAASSSAPGSASAAAACRRTSGRSWPGPASSARTRR